MNVKKIALLLLITLLVIGALAACTLGKDDQEVGGDIDLPKLVDELVADVDVPAFETITLGEDNFKYFAFTDYKEGYDAVVADALVNIEPHSLVVIHTENGDGDDLAIAVFDKADPNKWLCVGSEVVTVANTDHYVVLIMSSRDIANDITSNFNSMSEKLDNVKDITVHTKDNTIRYN